MEWKNVRRWLILLLLAADLILAGNLALQALRADQILYVSPCRTMPVEKIMDISKGERVVLMSYIAAPDKPSI